MFNIDIFNNLNVRVLQLNARVNHVRTEPRVLTSRMASHASAQLPTRERPVASKYVSCHCALNGNHLNKQRYMKNRYYYYYYYGVAL